MTDQKDSLAQDATAHAALVAAERELTDLARPVCSVFNRSTKKYEFTDDHIKQCLPGTFKVIQQLRAASASDSRSPAACELADLRCLVATYANEAAEARSERDHALSQVESMDAWLAKAADQLNVTPIMQAMDLGNEITQWRLARQKHTSTVGEPK